MEAAREERLVSLIGLTVALSALSLTIIEQVQIDRSVREAAAFGMIVDVSPDQLQMNIRVALALALGSISLWSSRTKQVAIVLGVLLCVVSFLIFLDNGPFDRREPLIHFTAVCCLIVAILVRHRRSNSLTAVLAGTFVLVNYLEWFRWTRRIKSAAAVEVLDPNTPLNNLLYGAHPWHIVLLGVTICLIVWEVRLLSRRTRASSVAEAE